MMPLGGPVICGRRDEIERVTKMAAFRLIAWMMIALAIALLGADAVSSLENGEMVMRSTGEILGLAGVDSVAVSDGAPAGVGKALGTVFDLPLWAVLGALGVILTLIFRPMD